MRATGGAPDDAGAAVRLVDAGHRAQGGPRSVTVATAIAIAVAIAVLALVWPATGTAGPVDWDLVVQSAAGVLVFLVAAVVVWRRQPANRIAWLLYAEAVLQPVVLLTYAPSERIRTAGWLLQSVVIAVYAHLALAWPDGRLRGRFERALASTVYMMALPANATLVLLNPEADTVLPRVTSPAARSVLLAVLVVVVAALAVLVLVAVVRRHRLLQGPSRRAHVPVVVGLPVLAVWTSLIAPSALLEADSVLAVLNSGVLQAFPQFALPVAFLLGALRMRLARAAVTGALLELGPLPSPAALELALRRRLGDEALQVLHWSPTLDGFVDGDGRVVPADDGGNVVVTALEREGRLVAGVLHDRALLQDPVLVEAITGAVQVALESDSVRAELIDHDPSAADLPAGEVTFLFADIEGSTLLLEQLGERYANLLSAFRRCARASTTVHNGAVVDARGDEVFAAFSTATAAVHAAADMQLRLAETAWPGDVTVRARMGLHTGRPTVTMEGYVGADVHRAARVMAAASGGQVLLSETVVRAVDDGPVETVPLGRFMLRGLAQPSELFELVVPGLPRRAFAEPRAQRARGRDDPPYGAGA